MTQKLIALCSISMLCSLWRRQGRGVNTNWWMVRRTPFWRRVKYWLTAPHKLHHGHDGYLYMRLSSWMYCHPRFWWPIVERSNNVPNRRTTIVYWGNCKFIFENFRIAPR